MDSSRVGKGKRHKLMGLPTCAANVFTEAELGRVCRKVEVVAVTVKY